MQSSFNRDNGQKRDTPKEKPGVYFPFMISSLLKYVGEADDNILRVKGVKVDKFILIGRVVSHEKLKNRWNLHIDDTTGSVSVTVHKLPVVDRPTLLEGIKIEDHVYVKVICSMKYTDSVFYVCDHVEEIKDFNLISNHILCSVHAMLSIDADIKPELLEDPAIAEQHAATSAMKEEYDHLPEDKRFRMMLRKIYDDLKKEQLSIEEIKRRLFGAFSESQISKNLKSMEENAEMSVTSISQMKYYEFSD